MAYAVVVIYAGVVDILWRSYVVLLVMSVLFKLDGEYMCGKCGRCANVW